MYLMLDRFPNIIETSLLKFIIRLGTSKVGYWQSLYVGHELKMNKVEMIFDHLSHKKKATPQLPSRLPSR